MRVEDLRHRSAQVAEEGGGDVMFVDVDHEIGTSLSPGTYLVVNLDSLASSQGVEP